MANFILVTGSTGAGKTTSIRTLNPKQTLILRSIKRKLPFKNANQFKVVDTPTYKEVVDKIEKANGIKGCKNIVITDGTYIMRNEFFDKISTQGYDKFSKLAIHIREILMKCQECRDDLNVIMEWHTEPVQSEGNIMTYKAATVGKLLDSQFNIYENVDIILYAQPRIEGTSVEYGFYTNASTANGALIPAKTPIGMFEENFVPNDLNLVVNKIKEYYGGEQPAKDTAPDTGGEDA